MKYPNLKNEKIIALDIETKDQDIRELGPGYYRAKYGLSDDEILTVSICTEDGKVFSYPWTDNVVNWLKDNSHLAIIGANTLYDLGWMRVSNDIIFNGRYYDILTQESFLCGIDDWYSLDKLAQKHLGVKKGNDEIKEYCENKGWKGDPRAHLYKMVQDPDGLELVLAYNESDASQTFEIYKKQVELIKSIGLEEVAELESKTSWALLEMRKNGVRIDENKIEQSSDEVRGRVVELQKKADKLAGFPVNVAANSSMKRAFENIGLSYTKTEKGNPSFKSSVLEVIDHDFARVCMDIRSLSKLQSTYLEGFEKFIVNGRVFTEFHPVKNGGRGAITGRFSATKPALQTIPKKGEGAKYARSIFIPEDGQLWVKQDQSQEELRVFSHFARGEGANDLVRAYNENPDMDHHQYTADYAGTTRSEVKAIVFGKMYGMGVHKFAISVGLPVPPPWPKFGGPDWFDKYKEHRQYIRDNFKAGQLFFDYEDKFPCMKTTAKAATAKAEQRGYAKTLVGRRRYLDKNSCYKALNTTVQGSAGDIMKLWMVGCHEAGLQDILTFHITVHDEYDFSMPDTKEGRAAAAEVKRIGENVVKLRVPLKVDHEEGPNWAEVK